MNTKHILSGITAILLSVSMLVTSCKKKEDAKEEPAVEESGQSSSDNRQAQSETDAAVNDINDVVGNESILRGNKSEAESGVQGITGTICGLTVDTVGIGKGSINLNYNGTTCNNRKRTGNIKLTVQNYSTGTRWKNPGCVIKVDYNAYRITRASDGKFIQLDGTQYLTNVSGGTWWELLVVKTQTSLVSSVSGTNLKVTFEDSKVATYNINRRFTYSIPGNILTCQGEGIGSFGGVNNLENYGTTREGEAFTSQVNTPIIWNLTCGPWAPVQGDVKVSVVGKGFDLRCLFGVDKDGNAVTVGANQCPYGWKLEWTVNSKTNSKVFGYN